MSMSRKEQGDAAWSARRQKVKEDLLVNLHRAQPELHTHCRLAAMDSLLALEEYEKAGDLRSAKFVASAHDAIRGMVKTSLENMPKAGAFDDGWEGARDEKPAKLEVIEGGIAIERYEPEIRKAMEVKWTARTIARSLQLPVPAVEAMMRRIKADQTGTDG